MSWHVYKELRSDKVAESRIHAVKTKLLKKHYSGLFTTKQNRRGRLMDWKKVFRLKHCNQNVWREKRIYAKKTKKKFSIYENMGRVLKLQTRFASTSLLFWYNLLYFGNFCVPTSDQWTKCKRNRVLLSVLGLYVTNKHTRWARTLCTLSNNTKTFNATVFIDEIKIESYMKLCALFNPLLKYVAASHSVQCA
jgi:hypothetical protein